MGSACSRCGRSAKVMAGLPPYGDEELQRMIPPEKEEESKAGGCSACCKRFACCTLSLVGLYVLFLLALMLVALLSPSVGSSGSGERCAVVEVDMDPMPKDFPLVIGTRENIAKEWPMDQVDLTGIWWIRWSDEDGLAEQLYNSQKREVLVTFADSTVENATSKNATGDNFFPAVLKQPAQETRHWGYSENFWSLIVQMSGHAQNWHPNVSLSYDFDNSSYAMIQGVGPFIYKNKDEWLRENYDGKLNYHLTRIVDENGDPNEWWSNFTEFMGDTKLLVWGSNDVCRRRCEVALKLMLSPVSVNCKVCNVLC